MGVMNAISLVGESISLIYILITEYHNIVNSLRKGLLPKNVVTGVILQKIMLERSYKFAGTKFLENCKVILSDDKSNYCTSNGKCFQICFTHTIRVKKPLPIRFLKLLQFL